MARKWPWALPELKVGTEPQSWSGEHLEPLVLPQKGD